MPDKYIDGLVQDCSNSCALAMESLHFCTKPWSNYDDVQGVFYNVTASATVLVVLLPVGLECCQPVQPRVKALVFLIPSHRPYSAFYRLYRFSATCKCRISFPCRKYFLLLPRRLSLDVVETMFVKRMTMAITWQCVHIICMQLYAHRFLLKLQLSREHTDTIYGSIVYGPAVPPPLL